MKICKILREYFIHKESGYYFITHETNYNQSIFNERIIDLGSFGVNIFFPNQSKIFSSSFFLIGLLFIILI